MFPNARMATRGNKGRTKRTPGGLLACRLKCRTQRLVFDPGDECIHGLRCTCEGTLGLSHGFLLGNWHMTE